MAPNSTTAKPTQEDITLSKINRKECNEITIVYGGKNNKQNDQTKTNNTKTVSFQFCGYLCVFTIFKFWFYHPLPYWLSSNPLHRFRVLYGFYPHYGTSSCLVRSQSTMAFPVLKVFTPHPKGPLPGWSPSEFSSHSCSSGVLPTPKDLFLVGRFPNLTVFLVLQEFYPHQGNSS